MSRVQSLLPPLIVNEDFIYDFVEQEAPCLALGHLEISGKIAGFLALRPDMSIPHHVTDKGLRLGHQLLGYDDENPVVLFNFHFYGFGSYNVLINPNNEIARTVLSTMIERGDYFFLAINPNNQVTTFRQQLQEADLAGLKSNFPRIKSAQTSDLDYARVYSRFSKKPDPAGNMLKWVCRDKIDYLDLSEARFEMSPA